MKETTNIQIANVKSAFLTDARALAELFADIDGERFDSPMPASRAFEKLAWVVREHKDLLLKAHRRKYERAAKATA